MLKRTLVILSIVAFSASCQKFYEGRRMFRELIALREQLAAQFHEKIVDVNVSTNSTLTVKFMDSALSTAPRDVKQKRADEVAAFVASHYKHAVSSVITVFVTRQGPARLEERLVGSTATQ